MTYSVSNKLIVSAIHTATLFYLLFRGKFNAYLSTFIYNRFCDALPALSVLCCVNCE